MPELSVPNWVRWWITLSAPIVTWDAGFVLLRPWTMEGGPLFPFWKPYKLYGTIDLIYSEEKWKEGDRFCEAQSVCNLFEVAFQLLALYLLRRKEDKTAAMVIIVCQTATLWKTTLYWLYDILGGFASSGHNPLSTWILLYGAPNCLWMILPFLTITALCGRVLKALHAPANSKKSE